MEYHNESGDLDGVEIFVVYTRNGYVVYFQDSEGGPNVPVIVPAVIKGVNISFVLPERNGYTGKFTGTIEPNRLKGRFEGGQIATSGKPDFFLTRGKSYWQSK